MIPFPHNFSATLLVAAALCSPLCEAQYFANLGVESAYIDNLTRSERSSAARGSTTLTPG